VAEKWTLSDVCVRGGDRGKLQCFRVRAGVFASAHGRPDGVPGRIIGARAKGLRWRGRAVRDENQRKEDSRFEISDLGTAGEGERISDLKFEISDLGSAGVGEGISDLKFLN